MKKTMRKKSTPKRLLEYVFKHNKSAIALVFISIMISVFAGLAGSVFIQILIDDYIMPMVETGENLFGKLFGVLAIMAAIFAAGIVCTWLYNRTMAVVAQKVLKNIRDDLFEKMETLPIRFFDTHNHGDVMSLYTNDTDTLRQFIAQSFPMLLSSIFTFVLTFCMMIYYNLILTALVLLFGVVIFVVSRAMIAVSSKYFVKQQDNLGIVNGYVEEMLGGQKVIKVFCHEEQAKDQMKKLNEDLFGVALRAEGTAGVMMPTLSGLGNLLYLFIAFAGGMMALFGGEHVSISIGTLIAFLGLGRQFSSSVTQTAQQMNSVVLGIAGASRIFELMDELPEQDEGYVTLVNATEKDGVISETSQDDKDGFPAWKHPHHDGTLTYTPVRGNVVFDRVDFSYDGKKTVLHDISLYAKPGQKIAFVGATGAGKTTITNLINRFYDLADGKIRYDGININKIKKPDLRKSMGVILQDVNLFTGTIMENIRYGKLDASDEECIAAAKLTGADSFIELLPDKYDTVIRGDGGSLSQGQCQLISIARAAVADPPVMIMDEATSSIDTRTEAIVQRGMDALMDGRTVFVIAHRLSTVRNSKAIIVLEHGRIIERGNHEQLIAEHGQYYQLYTGAFELE